jgi:hypothetical protein
MDCGIVFVEDRNYSVCICTLHAFQHGILVLLNAIDLLGNIYNIGDALPAQREPVGCSRIEDEASNQGVVVPCVRVLVDGGCTGGLTPKDHACGITTKCGNLVMEPFDGFSLI